MDALKDFPDFDTKLVTEKGDAICQKQDIFKGLMWFAYTNNFANWHVLKTEQVREIIAENKLKNKVSSLEDFALELVAPPEKDFNNAMGQESLTRFDQPKRKNKPNKNRKPGGENVIVANANKPATTNNNPNAVNKPANNKPNASNKLANNDPNGSNKPANNTRPNNRKKNKGNRNNPNQNRPQGERNTTDNKIIPNQKNEPKA
jgi:hypothetical protein